MALTPEEAQAKVRAVFGENVEVMPLKPPTDSDDDSETDIVDLITRVCYF